MAYEKNEIENVVAVIPQTEFTELRITEIGNNGKIECIDVRQWYCTSKNPIKSPTQKGIRVSVESLPTLLSAIMNCLGDEFKQKVLRNIL